MIVFLYFLIGLSFFDMFSQLPIMSTFAQSLGASVSLIGFIVAAYSFSNLFSNIFSGHFVDKNGPKIVLVIGFFVTGALLFTYSFITSPILLLIVRLLHGISAGLLVPAAFTYVSILNKKKKNGKAMAFSGAAVGFSAVFGPAFGGIVSQRISTGAVFNTIGFLMIIAGILSLIILKPQNVEKTDDEESEEKVTLQDYLQLLKKPGLLTAYLGAFSLMFSQGILAYKLPLKTSELQFGDQTSGMLLSIFGIVAILFFVLPTNRIYDRYRNEIIMAIGMLIIALALVGLSFTSQLSVMYGTMALYGIGFALLFPSISSLITIHSGNDRRGKAFGLFYGFFSLGVVFGSSITGMFGMTTTEAFLTSSVFLTISSIIALVVVRKSDSIIEKENITQ